MKRSYFSYLLFVIAMSAFVVLRVHAGRAQESQPVRPSEETQQAEKREETLADMQKKMQEEQAAAAEEEEIPEEDETEYLWHGQVDPKKEFEGLIPRIVCWGDSLTVSLDDKSAYPDVLRALSGCEVINYGVENENTAMIAMREGGLRVNVKATVLPADTNLIPIFLRTEDNGHVYFLDYGDGGVNPCSINGIEGELQQLNGAYYFKRSTKGERLAVDEGTQFKTFGMKDAKEDDILVIFAGTNDLPDSTGVKKIISLERSMIEASGSDKYIIVGLTYAGGIPEIDAVNEALSKEFGDHFVDIRRYMLNYGLADAGITPTEDDLADIKKGEIPASLRNDYVHGNKIYHRLLGEQIYRRMKYLGYVPDPEEGEKDI